MRAVLYDPDFAKDQIIKMNAQQHTQDTRDVRQAPQVCRNSRFEKKN